MSKPLKSSRFEEMGRCLLELQKRNLPSKLAPWSKPEKTDTKPKTELENPEHYLGLFETYLTRIRTAKDLRDLQKEIVIFHVNEFKLEQPLTLENFEDLLRDLRQWSMRTKEYLVGSEEEKQRVWQKLEEVIEVARQKFNELAKT